MSKKNIQLTFQSDLMLAQNSETYSMREGDAILPTKTIEPLVVPDDSNLFERTQGDPPEGFKVIQEIFSLRDGTIRNERWVKSFLLSGIVRAISDEFVACEIISDDVNKKTVIRNYPRLQFSHLPALKIGTTVKIKINEKPGSFRTDIIDGSNMGIEREFGNLLSWNNLSDFEMDDPNDINNEDNF